MTNTYLTGNPLGSTAAKDLYDNASNFDDAMNSASPSFIDRFSKRRETWAGMKEAFAAFLLTSGYEFLGDYDADGPLTITQPNQVFSKDGEYWRSGPSLSLPYTTVNNWAIDEPKFVSTGDATLRQALAAADGGSLVGLAQTYTGSVPTNLLDLFRRTVRLSDFGPAGAGADDTPYFLLARDSGKYVELDAGKTYRISTQIASTGDAQGFFVREGWATVIMLTGAGQFDRSDYSGGRYDANACGFLNLSFDDYVFSGIRVTLDAPVAVRTAKALAVRGSLRAKIDIEAFGFKECENGIVCTDSLTDSDVKAWVHDCGTANDTLASMQITGVDIDNTRVGGVYTTNTKVDARIERILLTGAALTKYNHQTDGVNVSGSGGPNHGLIITLIADSVGEGIDIFGSYIIATVSVTNCWLFGVKLIHGARHNIINATIDRTGGAAVVLGSSNEATQTVAWNIINATISNAGNLASTGVVKCAFQTDGQSALYQPEHNHVRLLCTQGGNMDYVISDEAGANNTYEYDHDSVTLAEINSPINKSTIRRLGAHRASYAADRYYGGGMLNLSSTGTQAYSENTMYFAPFEVTDSHNFLSIGIVITTSAGGAARLGIFRMERGVPTTLVKDCSTISVSATGSAGVSINGGGGIWLTPGMYCLAFVSNVGFSMSASSPNVQLLGAIGSTTPTGVEVCMQAAFTYGSLPGTAPTVSWDTIAVPNIWLRA